MFTPYRYIFIAEEKCTEFSCSCNAIFGISVLHNFSTDASMALHVLHGEREREREREA